MITHTPWETATYAAAIIEVATNTLISSIESLPDAEFYHNFDGTLPAVTALHLSGQLAWALQQTTGKKDARGEEFYGTAKGERPFSEIVPHLPGRSEIQNSYIENGKNVISLLNDYSQDKWAAAPLEKKTIRAFPSHAHLWTGVIWHTFWHLGELGSKVPFLRSRPELTHPTLFRSII